MSTTTDPAVVAAADRLDQAELQRVPTGPVRDLIGAGDIDRAYAVQTLLRERRLSRGGRVVGRKIGLTSEAVQRQVGVDQPDFGVLFADMRYEPGDTLPARRLLQPKAEAEVAFVLGRDLDEEDLSAPFLTAAVDHAVAALEIVDSRVRDWDIQIADTVADNASSGAFVLGTRRLGLDAFAPVEVQMRMSLEGREVSTGAGPQCLGDPLHALAWLARTAREVGDPLRAGDVVLSGALGPMVALLPGQTVTAELSEFGSVSITRARNEA